MRPENPSEDAFSDQPYRCYTYMVRCRDGSLYTGWTTDLEKRVKAHNNGTGARYTKSRGPVDLAYFETFSSKTEALRREVQIKRLSHREKEQLILEKELSDNQ